MGRKRLRSYVLLMLGASVTFAIFSPVDKTLARNDDKAQEKAAILKRLADYRSWKQINSQPQSNSLSNAFMVETSSNAG